MKRLLALVLLLFVGGNYAVAQTESETMRQLQKLVRAYRLLERYYVDSLPAERVADGA